MNTASDRIEQITSCTRCRNHATHICNGCHDTIDIAAGYTDSTWYCSRKCQVADWPNHKWTCKQARERRPLYRAGRIIQLVFFGYLEKVLDISINKIEKRENDLYLHLGEDKLQASLPLRELFSSEEDRLAALTLNTCGNALGFVHVLLEIMLPDAIRVFERVDYLSKPPRRHVFLVRSSGSQVENAAEPHAIIKVTLKSGGRYAVDITSAQFGYHEPVHPWRIYRNSRMKSILSIEPLKSIKEGKRQIGNDRGAVDSIIERDEEYAELVGAAAKAWQLQNMDLSTLLEMREGEFHSKKAELLEFIDTKIRDHKRKKL